MKDLFFVTVGVFILGSICFNLLGIYLFNPNIAIQPWDNVSCTFEYQYENITAIWILTWEVERVSHKYYNHKAQNRDWSYSEISVQNWTCYKDNTVVQWCSWNAIYNDCKKVK